MQKCSLTIVTDVDGEKTTFSCKAEMELTPLSARLRYMQNTDVTVLSFKNQTVTVAREGDYSMRLTLKEGKTLEGKFILNGNEGVFPVQTQKVAYAITEKSLLQAVATAVEMTQNGDHGIPTPDYTDECVSTKVVKIIQSYTGIVDKMVWRKY